MRDGRITAHAAQGKPQSAGVPATMVPTVTRVAHQSKTTAVRAAAARDRAPAQGRFGHTKPSGHLVGGSGVPSGGGGAPGGAPAPLAHPQQPAGPPGRSHPAQRPDRASHRWGIRRSGVDPAGKPTFPEALSARAGARLAGQLRLAARCSEWGAGAWDPACAFQFAQPNRRGRSAAAAHGMRPSGMLAVADGPDG